MIHQHKLSGNVFPFDPVFWMSKKNCAREISSSGNIWKLQIRTDNLYRVLNVQFFLFFGIFIFSILFSAFNENAAIKMGENQEQMHYYYAKLKGGRSKMNRFFREKQKFFENKKNCTLRSI